MSSFNIDIRGDVAGKMDKLTEDNVLQTIEDELNAFGLETVAMAKSNLQATAQLTKGF